MEKISLTQIYLSIVNKPQDKEDDSSYVMLFVDLPLSRVFSSNIDPTDLCSIDGHHKGIEKDPHITLLGNIDPEAIKSYEDDVLKKIKDVKFEDPIMLGNISIFECPEYDVLKLEVISDADRKKFEDCNKKLSKLKHTSKHKYVPHLTIGYFNKGCATKYIKMFEGIEFTVIPKCICISNPYHSVKFDC